MKNYQESLVPQVIKLFTEQITEEGTAAVDEAGLRDIVFRGTFEEVNEFFYKNLWGDGLPLVPPTIAKVEEFLKYTDRSPNEVLGIFLPENREATVWTVAVNGVLAGCRPEYMPVLIAVVEAMADPGYRIQDAGSTPGWEAIIILNGPIKDQLGFNYREAVLRPGYQANTTIGRFYRLFCRNVPRLLPGTTDKATYGQPFRPVLPENDEVCAQIGWKPLSVVRGFQPGENVVTVVSIRGIGSPIASTGEAPEHHLDYLVDGVKRAIEPYRAVFGGRPKDRIEANLLILSPLVASILAAGGYSKDDVKRYIHQHAVISAREFEQNVAWSGYMPVEWSGNKPFNLREAVERGILSKKWSESTDPNRMVPLMLPSTDWLVIVSGDPARNRSLVCRQNYEQGWPISKKIELPAKWEKLLKEASAG